MRVVVESGREEGGRERRMVKESVRRVRKRMMAEEK